MTQFTSGSYNLHGVLSAYLPCPFLTCRGPFSRGRSGG